MGTDNEQYPKCGWGSCQCRTNLRIRYQAAGSEPCRCLYIWSRNQDLWYNSKRVVFLRPTPQKTYLIGESAFRSNEGGEQHG